MRNTSRKKTTVINLCVHGAVVLLAFISGVVLVPLYLKYIPSDLYGAWQASGNILTWITLFDPGISSVLQQRVAAAYGSQDRHAVAAWIASGLWVTAGVALLVLCAGIVCSHFLASWMRLPPMVASGELACAFRWNVVGTALLIFSFSVGTINQGLQASLGFGIITVVGTVIRILLVVVLVINGFRLQAIALPSVAMGLVLVIGQFTYLRVRLRQEEVTFSWKPTQFRQLVGLISFTAIGRCAGILINNVDLFLVARLLGPENVNVLRFTRTAPEMSRMFVERPVAALQPALAHLLGTGNVDRAREILLRLIRLNVWLLALCVAGFLTFNESFVRLWVGSRFYAGRDVNGLIVAAFLASVCMSILCGLCFAAGNIRGNSLAGVAQAIVYLPLLWAGGRWFGMKGVVAAGLLSVVLTQGWYMPRTFSRLFRMAKDDRDQMMRTLLLASVGALVPSVLFRLVHPQNWFSFSVWIAAFSICYLLLLLLLCPEARAEVCNCWIWTQQQLSGWRERKRS